MTTSHRFPKNLLIGFPLLPRPVRQPPFLGLKIAAAQASGLLRRGGIFGAVVWRSRANRSRFDMTFQLPDLPFATDALAPVMSAETLEYHHGKHHKAYVTNTNELVQAERDLSGASLLQVVKDAKRSGNQKLFNNSAQLWNHSFFWQCLAPAQGQQPDGKLAKLIEDGFGNPQALLDKLQEEAVNHFSNGWAWLVLDRGALRVTSLHDADT